MSKYNDFDLDVRYSKDSYYNEIPLASVTETTTGITDISLSACGCSIFTKCLTDESCSDCHSYCGSACR